jgi:hypothetical protein
MQSVLPLKVEPPKVAGGGAAPARSLERLLMGTKELLDADAQYVPTPTLRSRRISQDYGGMSSILADATGRATLNSAPFLPSEEAKS